MNHVFKLQGNIHDFQTGLTQDGRQVIMGLLCPNVVAYFFSTDGDLLERQARDWEYPAPRFADNGPYRIYDERFRHRLSAQVAGWQKEIGFVPQPVQIKLFFDETQSVGIKKIPEYLKNFDWCEDEAELDEARNDLKEWMEKGTFVFVWAKDYFVSPDGEIESS